MSNPSEKRMDYIRVSTSLVSDPKFIRLASTLKSKGETFSSRDLVGSLVYLWMNTGGHYNNGELACDPGNDSLITELSQWHGDAEIWVNALIHTAFLDRIEGGFYVHNWVEKHARQWLLKQESRERTVKLARDRVRKHREKTKERLRSAENEIKFLKDSMGTGYDPSPLSPPDVTHVTHMKRVDTVSTRVVQKKTVGNADQKVTSDNLLKQHSKEPSDTNLQLNINDPECNGDETLANGFTAYKRLDESKRQRIANPEFANHQTCVAEFLKGFEEATGQPYQESKIGHVGTIISNLNKNYPYEEIKRRMPFYFKSTWKGIKGFRAGGFRDHFMALQNGPLIDFENDQGGKDDGGLDKPKNIATVDDFQ